MCSPLDSSMYLVLFPITVFYIIIIIFNIRATAPPFTTFVMMCQVMVCGNCFLYSLKSLTKQRSGFCLSAWYATDFASTFLWASPPELFLEKFSVYTKYGVARQGWFVTEADFSVPIHCAMWSTSHSRTPWYRATLELSHQAIFLPQQILIVNRYWLSFSLLYSQTSAAKTFHFCIQCTLESGKLWILRRFKSGFTSRM